MPRFSIKLSVLGEHVFRHHAFDMRNVVFEPAQVQVPGDVETIGDVMYGLGPGGAQRGKLLNEVVATFPDGFQFTLPINTEVLILTNRDGSPNVVIAAVNARGQPELVPAVDEAPPAGAGAALPAGGAGGQGGGRRRRRVSQRRRRATRRRRYSRRR